MKIEHISIVGLIHALHGMRNPKDSWKLSDTYIIQPVNPLDPSFEKFKELYPPEQFYHDGLDGYSLYRYDYKDKEEKHIKNSFYINPYRQEYFINTLRQDYFDGMDGSKNKPKVDDFTCFLNITTDRIILIGPKDFYLMKTLSDGGPVHRKFARMIVVYLDITASFDFWKEFDTYKVGTVANSCSTMHTITKHPITINNYSIADLRPKDIEHIKQNIDYCNSVLNDETLDDLEKTRILSKINCTGFEQKRTIMLNYEVMANICKFRCNHKLAEWRYLTNYIFKKLPYFDDLFNVKYKSEDELGQNDSQFEV